MFLQAGYPKLLQTPKKDATELPAAPPNQDHPIAQPLVHSDSRTAAGSFNPLKCSLFRAGDCRAKVKPLETVSPLFHSNLSYVADALKETSLPTAEPEQRIYLDPILFDCRTTYEAPEPALIRISEAPKLTVLPFEHTVQRMVHHPSSSHLQVQAPQIDRSRTREIPLPQTSISLMGGEKDKYPLQNLSSLVSGLGSKAVPKRTARFDYQLDPDRTSNLSRNSSSSLFNTIDSQADRSPADQMLVFHPATSRTVSYFPPESYNVSDFNSFYT